MFPMQLQVAPDGYGFIGPHGYRFVISDKGAVVQEHRLVWETERGPIPDGWHVHHLNQDILDNSIENLLACSPRTHRRIHQGWRKIKGEYHKLCPQCETWQPGSKFYRTSKPKQVHPICKDCLPDYRELYPEMNLTMHEIQRLHSGNYRIVDGVWQRRCAACDKWLTLDRYHQVRRHAADGSTYLNCRSYCKSCWRKRRRALAHKYRNPERELARQRAKHPARLANPDAELDRSGVIRVNNGWTIAEDGTWRKPCGVCGKVFSLDHFYRSREGAIAYRCKRCVSIDAKERYARKKREERK
jgi:hypothetical protein